MRVMRDFQCDDGHITEQFVDSTVEQTTCSVCGKPAYKQLSAARSKLEPFSGAFPGAYYAWNNMRLEKAKQERKAKAADADA
jgi:hypothetical protein